MIYYFNIAGVVICITAPFEIDWHPSIKKFMTDTKGHIDVYYELYLSNDLQIDGKILYQDDRQIISKHNNLEKRLHYFFGQNEPCMLYSERKNGQKNIYLNNKFNHFFKRKNVYCIFNALAFEKILINYHAIILHCSYIIVQNKAILFTAPSFGGKSTQACIWRDYGTAIIINSDRAIIKKKNGIYYAMGIPIDGSSDICINRSIPISCIVYLHKSDVNTVKKINKKEAVKKLISETTINFFNQEFINNAFDIILDIAENLPVYELWCTKDKSALKCLENKLQEDNVL